MAASALLESIAQTPTTVAYGPNASCVVQLDPTLATPPTIIAFGTEAISVAEETASQTQTRTVVVPLEAEIEPNNSRAEVYDLGRLDGETKNLSQHSAGSGGDDWFAFTLAESGGPNDKFELHYTHSEGDVELELYNASGTCVASSRASTGYENISLNGSDAGTYYVRVYGGKNTAYELTIDAPTRTSALPDTIPRTKRRFSSGAAWKATSRTSLKVRPTAKRGRRLVRRTPRNRRLR